MGVRAHMNPKTIVTPIMATIIVSGVLIIPPKKMVKKHHNNTKNPKISPVIIKPLITPKCSVLYPDIISLPQTIPKGLKGVFESTNTKVAMAAKGSCMNKEPFII
jgi:hypothetical protein